ncbi:hypothetical protein [Halobiforma nitratireducens]|uniref:40-residue YVTN family beta-propeller repeat-containing protein n=1 Tax=Halobiforma nitratireducens JCM 10879 TaxID=1227454 RepID=M0L5S2_9EURY|nr:hypothetical protein [Halobiforma nitratireducens]EMA27340.1 hypothetical protein C446_18066 [Halobiforma nitratireducens JCM 10879]
MTRPTQTTRTEETSGTVPETDSDSFAIVKNAGSSYFSAVDPADREEIARLGDGSYPHTAVFHPDGRHAILLYISSSHLEVVDLERLETVQRIDDLGVATVGSALTRDGKRLFVGTAAELPDDPEPGVVALRVVGADGDEGDAGDSSIRLERIGTQPIGRCAGMCIGPNGLVYVADKKAGELVALSPTAELSELERYHVGSEPHDIYPVPGTDLIAVNNAGESFTTFVDAAEGAVRGAAPTGENPHGITFADGPGGKRAYVPARDDERVAAIDIGAVTAGDDDPTTFVDVETTTGFAATAADDRYVLVDSYDEPRVTIVDAETLSVAGHVTVDGEPLHLVVGDDGSECYVGNMDRPSVTVLDLEPLRADRPDEVTVVDRIDGLGEMPSGIFQP